MACMLMQFAWNYIANLNNGLWSYYLLNHMNFSYTLINVMSSLYTVMLISLTSPWQKVLRRYSWIKTFGIAVLWWVPTEVIFFMMTPDRPWIFIPMCLVQHALSVGLNLSYANILYTNLPDENSTSCIAFNTIGCNLFAFLGLITGTAVSGISGDSTMPFLGMQVYSVQFTTLMRAGTMLIMGIILVRFWRSFTRDDEIEEIERDERVRRELKEKNKNRTHSPPLAVEQTRLNNITNSP